MAQSKFAVGQRVAVLRDYGREIDGIHPISKITHNGTRIYIDERPTLRFDSRGRCDGLQLVVAEPEHEAALERKRLLARIDDRLGTYDFTAERERLRGAIPLKTLRDVAALLDLVEMRALVYGKGFNPSDAVEVVMRELRKRGRL